GFRTESTSAVVTASTGVGRSRPAYFRNVISHWEACLALRQDGRMLSIRRSAHSPNEALLALCRLSLGLMPSASFALSSLASSRDGAGDSSGAEPYPISVGFPCQR